MKKDSGARFWLAKNKWLLLSCLILGAIVVFLLWPGPQPRDEALADLEKKANYAYTVGDLEQAQALCTELLEETEREFGPLHPNVITALNNLALVLQARGDYGRALPLMERALRTHEAVRGEKHPDMVVSYTNLGLLYQEMGRPEEAARMHEKALEVVNASLPPDHPYAAYVQANLDQSRREAEGEDG